MRRLLIGLVFAALVVPAGAVYADSDQSCSQRGGKKNSVTCITNFSVTTGNVGTVKVSVLSGNRVLNNSEVSILRDAVTQVALLCNQQSGSQECANDIAVKVLAVVKSFSDFDEKKACATVKKSKSCEYA